MPHNSILDANTQTETHTGCLHLRRLIINILIITPLRPHILLAEISTTGIQVTVLFTTGLRAMGITAMAITGMGITAAWTTAMEDPAIIRHQTLSTSRRDTSILGLPVLLPMATMQFTINIRTAIIMDRSSSKRMNLEVKPRGGDEGICLETRQTC